MTRNVTIALELETKPFYEFTRDIEDDEDLDPIVESCEQAAYDNLTSNLHVYDWETTVHEHNGRPEHVERALAKLEAALHDEGDPWPLVQGAKDDLERGDQ